MMLMNRSLLLARKLGLRFCSAARPLHAWRCLLLRASDAKLGEAVNAYRWARIRAPWNLEVGIIVA
jgi:hypothetical protein